MSIRGSVGNNITATTILTNRIVQSIGLNNSVPFITQGLVILRGVHVYQADTTQKSLRLIRHRNDQLHSADVIPTRWSLYNNAATTTTNGPSLIKWSIQPSVIAANPLASAIIGASVGDSAHIMFDIPIEIAITDNSSSPPDPYDCIGLQVGESGLYNLNVTWIYEYTYYGA